MKIFSVIIKWREYRTRRDALVQLRAMTDRSLIDCNFSPELIKEGMKAWPWQMKVEDGYRVRFDLSVPLRSDFQSIECGNSNVAVGLPEEQEQRKIPQQMAHRSAA